MTFSLHGTLQSFFIGVSLCYVTFGCPDEAKNWNGKDRGLSDLLAECVLICFLFILSTAVGYVEILHWF